MTSSRGGLTTWQGNCIWIKRKHALLTFQQQCAHKLSVKCLSINFTGAENGMGMF